MSSKNSKVLRKAQLTQAGINTLLRLRNAGAGYKMAGGMFLGVLGYTYLRGPKVESELLR